MKVTNTGKRILRFLEEIYKINFDGRENLEALRRHLKEGSVVLVYNHLSLDDTFILGKVLISEAGEVIERVTIPGSRKWWKRPITGYIMRLTSHHLGVEISPVVQHYQKGVYSSSETFFLLWQFGRIAKEILGIKGGMVLLAPEGTREGTQRKGLQSPQTGVESLIRLVKWRGFNAKIMPIGIEPQGRWNRQVNPFRRLVIHFGPLLSVEEIDGLILVNHLSLGEVVMKEIAALLPSAT